MGKRWREALRGTLRGLEEQTGDPLLPTGTRLGLDPDFGFGEMLDEDRTGGKRDPALEVTLPREPEVPWVDPG